MRACEELGPELHLHEVALRAPYMRFDSPGDFQLMPRQALFDINGFEERMTHGWHADSNMCKRLCLYFGNQDRKPETQSEGLPLRPYPRSHAAASDGYQAGEQSAAICLGLRRAGGAASGRNVGRARRTGGRTGFRERSAGALHLRPEADLGRPTAADYPTDANDSRNFVFYHQEHALPYLAGNLTVYPRDARFVYAGNNPKMLGLCWRAPWLEMGFTQPLALRERTALCRKRSRPRQRCDRGRNSGDGSRYEHCSTNYNLLIFDFGLDQSGLNLGKVARVTDWPRELRYSLGAVARCLEACAEQSDGACTERAGGSPDFLVLNAIHYVFQRFLAQFLLSTETPYPVHVRKGRPRIGEDRRYRGVVWKYNEDLLRSFFAYDQEDASLVTGGSRTRLDFTSEGHSAPYKDGHWGAMDYTGTWIDGYKAAILFAPSPSYSDDLVVYVRINEAFFGPEEEPMRLKVFFEGEFLVRWTVYTRFQTTTCKAVLPARLMAGKQACRLEFHAENPQSAERVALASGQRLTNEDPRELSVKVQKVTFTGADRLRYSLSDTLDFTEDGQGIHHINECWTQADGFGVWTLGPDANLVLLLERAGGGASDRDFHDYRRRSQRATTVSGRARGYQRKNRGQMDAWDPRALPMNAESFCPRDSPLQIPC